MMRRTSELLIVFDDCLPEPEEIARMTVEKNLAGERGKPKFVKKNFSRLFEELNAGAYNTFLSAQKMAWKKAIPRYCGKKLKTGTSTSELVSLIEASFDDFNDLFMSLSQSRKARAGSTFEYFIKEMFKKLDYPFEEQQVINGKPDFLMPSRAHYNTNAMDCIIFTAKRTLRERWKQIVTEGTRGLGFFLATIDADVTKAQLMEMKRNRIYLVVPALLKQDIQHYKKAVNVITFEKFFQFHLDPAMKRWKDEGVIS
jgi:hypothetical protein